MAGEWTIADAQRDVRTTFLGGFRGQLCVVAVFGRTSAPAYGDAIGWFTGAQLVVVAFMGRRVVEAR